MKRILISLATFSVLVSAAAYAADDTQTLIALDKQWGESITKGDKTVSEKLLADNIVSVDENGMMGRSAMLADIKPAPAGTRYEPTAYKVTFLNPDTAIMTHGTKGADAPLQSARMVPKGRLMADRRYVDDQRQEREVTQRRPPSLYGR